MPRPNWLWICAGRGITPPTRCGGSWILYSGGSHITLGASFRRFLGIRSRAYQLIPLSAKVSMICCKPNGKRQRLPRGFNKTYPQAPLTCVAYFSMEFMLSEALPIYSGGLGNVAGDQLKAASDLGVPVIGVGLLYQQGYFRQLIDNDGAQQAIFPYNDPGQLPITPLRQANGEWLRLQARPAGPPDLAACLAG